MRAVAARCRSLVVIAVASTAGVLVLVLPSSSSASMSTPKLPVASTVKAPTKCPSSSEVGAALGRKEPKPIAKTAADYIRCTYGTSALADKVEMYGSDLSSFEAGEKLSAALKPKSISGLGQKAYYAGGVLFVLDNGLLYEVASVMASLASEEKLVRELIASP